MHRCSRIITLGIRVVALSVLTWCHEFAGACHAPHIRLHDKLQDYSPRTELYVCQDIIRVLKLFSVDSTESTWQVTL